MDPLEIVRHAESKCHAWFEANHKKEESEEIQNPHQASISQTYMIDGSWTSDALSSGYGWAWTNSSRVTQLLGARNQRRRTSPLHSELNALSWVMECMLQLSTC